MQMEHESRASLLMELLFSLLDDSQPAQSSTILSHLILELMIDNFNRQVFIHHQHHNLVRWDYEQCVEIFCLCGLHHEDEDVVLI